MKQQFFRKSQSLLDPDGKENFVFLNTALMEIVLKNTLIEKRFISQIQQGRDELEKRLTKARITFFSKEDMANWLSKIKEDAKLETDKIAIKFESTFGRYENNIDFERAGFLTGLYDAADNYLNEMTAAKPIHLNRAHYSIYDKLEKLDKLYLKNDNLPGYYQIQKDKKIKKHVFELKNLDDFWQDYLSLKDKHQVTEDFGDKQFLLQQYHLEFAWQLIQIKPRADIKLMLDYHYHKYHGTPDDFLEHIEFRVLETIEGIANTERLVFRQLIVEWLREKKQLLSEADEQFLLESIVAACTSFLNSLAVHRPLQDENKYNTVIRDLLQQGVRMKGWFVNDQSMGGFTDSTSMAFRAGIASRDLILVNEKQQTFSIIEFFRLTYVPKSGETYSVLSSHLNKIFRNEITGISPLFMIIYSETSSFAKTWEKYLAYVEKFDFGNYPLVEVKKDLDIKPERINLKLAISLHKREEGEISLHHLFINMLP